MSGTWTVTKAKLSGRTRVWAAYRIGSDAYGTWFFAPAGTPNHDPAGELIDHVALDGVQLIPEDTWWVAWWWADGSITVDIATPAEFEPTSVRYVDLELDLWSRNGEHGLVDQAEYEACRAAGLIPDDQDGPALSAVADVERMLAGRDEPFGGVGWQWLDRSRSKVR